MGTQKPEGLKISRSLWLDESGRGITFRDKIVGQIQQIWRLDAAPGQELGSVRTDGQGLLVTRNPTSGAAGIEIRSRNMNLEATGRIEHTSELPASGWQADTDALNVTLNLPPRLAPACALRSGLGPWRLADGMESARPFSASDFFPGGVSTVGSGSGHSALSRVWPFLPGTRRTALRLARPVDASRFASRGSCGWARRLVIVWKWLTIAALVFFLVPFVARQVQQALYPQLEFVGAVQPLSSQRFEAVDVQAAPTSEAAEEARAKSAGPRRVARQH